MSIKSFVTLVFCCFLAMLSPLKALDHASTSSIAESANLDTVKLEMTFFDGKSFDLKKGNQNATLVIFWVKWCGICKKQLRDLEDIYSDLKQKNIETIGLSIDKNSDITEAKEIVKNYSFANGHLSEVKVFKGFEVPRSIPTIYFLDSKQKIIKIAKGRISKDEIKAIFKI